MFGHMSGRDGVTSGTGSGDCGLMVNGTCRGMRSYGRLLRISDAQFTTRPGACSCDREPRPIIRAAPLEKRQNMFRTICGPRCELAMLLRLKRSAAMSCHETPIAHRAGA